MDDELDLSQLIDDSLDDDGPSLADIAQQTKTLQLMQALLDNMARPQPTPQINVAAARVAAPQVIIQPAPRTKPCGWNFEFVRNKDRTLKSIIATPLE